MPRPSVPRHQSEAADQNQGNSGKDTQSHSGDQPRHSDRCQRQDNRGAGKYRQDPHRASFPRDAASRPEMIPSFRIVRQRPDFASNSLVQPLPMASRHQSHRLCEPRPILHRSRRLWQGGARFRERRLLHLQLDEPFIATCDPGYRATQNGRRDDSERLAETLCRHDQCGDLGHSDRYDMTIQLGISWSMTASAAGGLEAAPVTKERVAGLGLVTTKSMQLESEDEIKRRIAQAAKFVRCGSALPSRLNAWTLRLDQRGQCAG
jgi:hypothetical protein